ncbi:MAG: hypothetical protein NTV30_07755, partial [Chloroflexi bacterium]|nr:hypothetical protein [Chloroflexota bacterium]
ISIKNIGKGPAYSIFFEPIELEGYRYRFYLENPMLESLEEKEPRAVVRTPKGGTEAFNRDSMWFLHRLIPQTLTNDAVNYALQNPAIFLAHYQGSNGVMYYSVFALYCNLPPTGDILMQFIIHGRGEFSVDEAKKAWSLAKKIRSPFER